jgi:molecular chaperone DnaJ
MTQRCYYEVLSIERDANEDEVRKAYRKAALKHHPDRNQGDAEAEVRFKEATQAYSVLSDAQKRQTYDRFGHAAVSGSGAQDFQNAGVGDIFNHFQDLFSDFFGGFGGQQQRRRGPERGQDLRVETVIDFKDMLTGCKQAVTVNGAAACETCSGSGSKNGGRPETCGNCRGTGQATTQRGFIVFSTNCPQCGGRGEVIKDPCGDCHAQGFVAKRREVNVTFPAGIDAGVRLRVPGQGMPGPNGVPPGDLYVDVDVRPDDDFQREGYDLVIRESVSFAEATLGSDLELDLPDGTSAAVSIKAGTQPGTIITVRGKGVPRLDRRGRGDLHVVAEVEVPRKLSRRARKLLLELEEEIQGKQAKHAKSAS